MSKFGKLMPLLGLSLSIRAQAEDSEKFSDQINVNPITVSERCITDLSPKELTKLSEKFKFDLAKALLVTPDERNSFETGKALEFAKKVREMDINALKTRLDTVERITNLENEEEIKKANDELDLLDTEIDAMKAVLLEHLQENGAGNYDLFGFTPQEKDIVERDLAVVFAAYAEKGIDCPSDVKKYVHQNGNFPKEGELVSSIMATQESGAEEAILANDAEFTTEDDSGDLKKEKSKFMKHSTQTKKEIYELDYIAGAALSKIKDRYINKQ